MSPEKLQEFEATLRLGVKKAQERGLTIAPGAFGVSSKRHDNAFHVIWDAYCDRVCPIGAALIGLPVKGSDTIVSIDKAATKSLGLELSEVNAFVDGFDRRKLHNEVFPEVYALGLKLRAELVPK